MRLKRQKLPIRSLDSRSNIANLQRRICKLEESRMFQPPSDPQEAFQVNALVRLFLEDPLALEQLEQWRLDREDGQIRPPTERESELLAAQYAAFQAEAREPQWRSLDEDYR